MHRRDTGGVDVQPAAGVEHLHREHGKDFAIRVPQVGQRMDQALHQTWHAFILNLQLEIAPLSPRVTQSQQQCGSLRQSRHGSRGWRRSAQQNLFHRAQNTDTGRPYGTLKPLR
jgi:hypothetical protein